MPEPQNNPAATRALRRIGAFFCERYRISHLIGIGGTSAVYAGVHRNGHTVAIKVLHERLSDVPDVERRFRREALIANRIQHPGVVPIIDDDVADDGATFLVMPLLLGETVRARAARQADKRLPVEEVIAIAHALLDTLQAAHALKIVHRDIKPDNLFITASGDVRVFDFGIARFFENDDSASITRSEQAMGTPAFMAPEQALGRVRHVDGQTDLWAVGATMFTLLSGQHVHEAESSGEVLVRAATVPARALASVAPGVPPVIREVVDRALAFEKRERWPDASTMQQQLALACQTVFGTSPSGLPGLAVPDVESPPQVHDATTLPPAPLKARTAVADSAQPHPRLGARTPSVRSTRRARLPWVGAALAASALLLGGTAARFLAAPATPAATPSATAEGGPPRQREAAIALEAGLQLWRDASTDNARSKFAEAARLDPGLAEAHLYFAAVSEWVDPEVRTHFTEAQSLRRRLSAVQAGLLEALEPVMLEPPDMPSATKKLAALTTQFPSEELPWLVRGAHAVRTRDATDLLSFVDRVPGAIALSYRSRASIVQDDVDGARQSLQECIASQPQGGVDCLIRLAQLEANEGNCDNSAAAARRLIAVDHASPEGYRYLARAEFGRSHRTAAVRAILEERWSRLVSPRDDVARCWDEYNLAIQDGQFDVAYRVLDTWDKAALTTADGALRWLPFAYRIDLDLELGRIDAAKAAARAAVDASQTWLPNESWYMPAERTRALYFTGLISRDEAHRQQVPNEQGFARGGFYSPDLRWIDAYVQTVRDAEDAQFAISHRPSASPILDAEHVDLFATSDVGHMYLLAGDVDKALVSLHRASNSCLFAKALYSVHAHAWYGDALAKAARKREACEQYGYVFQRWGHEPRSRTVRAVSEGAARLECPPPSVGGTVQGAVNQPEAREKDEHGPEGHR
ncbi:serine/threonine protein kinase [Pendulispora rubella]|uniref:Serine/threonine protein kinase n=1 Tax=Pendulispora rubella TaxID=2741070 RepID=A0ABZ2LE98_9BACT